MIDVTQRAGARPGVDRESPWGKSREARSQTGSEGAFGLAPAAAAKVHCQQGLAYRRLADYALTVEDRDLVIAWNPEHADAHYSRGLGYQRFIDTPRQSWIATGRRSWIPLTSPPTATATRLTSARGTTRRPLRTAIWSVRAGLSVGAA